MSESGRKYKMTSWHSLSGYLEYKTSGALGKLKGSRRLWFILEDSSSLLLFYRDKEEATKQRDARGKIPLHGAGISLNSKERNQFVVISGEREHFFTADNHESLMVWLMGLQAKRDFFTKKRLGMRLSEEEPHSPTEVIKEEYEVIDSPPSPDIKPGGRFLPASQDCIHVQPLGNPNSYHSNTKEALEAVSKPKVILKDTRRSLTTSTLDLYRKQKNQHWWRQQRLKKILGESMDGGLDLYKDDDTYFEDIKHLNDLREQRAVQSLPNSRPASMFYSVCSLHCEDSVFIPDAVLSADESMVTRQSSSEDNQISAMGIKKASSEGMDINKGVLIAAIRENQRRSGSGRSGSSDSLLDRNSDMELLSQLNELEQQLISTKCEMAMLLNRETCFKEVLERRDTIILELDSKLEELAKRKEADKKMTDKKLKEDIRQLRNQNRFLNEEVRRLVQLRQRETENFQQHNIQMQKLHATLERWKQDYVYLLQSTITIPTGDVIDGMDVTLYGGSRHRERVRELLDECRQINPCLPTFERLARSDVHMDNYGFKHTHPTEGLMLHYICQQLHMHYQSRLSGWGKHQQNWRDLLRKSGPALHKTKELKLLCRHGVPEQMRAEIWKKLVQGQVGHIKEEKGPHYYTHLVNMAYDSQYAGRYRKQIMLDLLRTMPTNINFKTKESEGIIRMKEVLQAFCMHNPDIGYCQGLNFIVGMCLLFLDTEDAFWTLVAITEKYFSPNYFDKSLSGAQADQEVLKDMVRYKLPAIYDHLQSIDIELSTVTFNWFLAIFFEAVPFQTMIHIWDTFLVEGPKVLFRYSVAILKMNQAGIVAKKDTINVMRHLKVCGKLMYDTQGLSRVAFQELRPFPRRRDIAAKQVVYLNALKEKLKKREEYRRTLDEQNKKLEELDMIPPTALVYECAAPCGQDLVWICVGGQNNGKVMSVQCGETLARDTEIEMESNILSILCLEDEMLLVGTLSRVLHVFSVKTTKELWSLTLNDSIFSLCCLTKSNTNRLFIGMGDGTVAILDQIQPKEPQDEPFYIPVGRSPVGAIILLDEVVWLACGNAIHVMQAQSLDMLDKITISGNPFDHVLMLAQGSHGIWTTIKGSSVLELWDTELLTCKLLYDVRFNKMIPRKGDEDGSLNKFRITTILPVDDTLWVGTGDGLLTVYQIQDRSHIRRSHSSGSLRNGRPFSPKELRRQRKKTKEGRSTESRQKASRNALRNSREESRSREMLLNGMLDDDDEDSVEEKKFKGRGIRKSEKSADIKHGIEIRNSRRSRVQELKSQVVLSSSCPEPHVLLRESRGMSLSSIDVRPTPKKMEANHDLVPDRLWLYHKEQSKSSNDLRQDRSPTNAPVIKSLGLEGADATSYKTIKAKLKRQKDISKKSSDEDRTRLALEKNHGNLKGTDTADVTRGNHESSSKDHRMASSMGVSNNVFGNDSSETHWDQNLHRIQLMDCPKKSNVQSSEPPEDKDFNMNVPSKSLPEILKGLSKTQAPPQESLVTPRSCLTNMDPTIHVCSPSSVSTLTDGESPVKKGLARDPIFNFDEQHLNKESTRKVKEKPLIKKEETEENQETVKVYSSSSPGSQVSKASTKKSRKKSRQSKKPPEIAVDLCEKEDPTFRLSMEQLQVSDITKDNSSPISDTQSARFFIGGTTPELGRRSLSPNFTSQMGDGYSDDSRGFLRTPSSSTLSSSSFSDLTYMVDLGIQTKVKVSDRPVKCIVTTKGKDNPVILTCAGCYGDDEAVLKWSKKCGESIWTNEPVLEVCPVTNMPRRPSYMQHMALQRSFST